MDMKKIIFLDFDGVMVTDKYLTQLMADGYSIEDEYGSFFDSDCVKNLKEIIDLTDAEIVVTSTWKMTLGLDGLQAMWETRNLPGKVVGVTPDIDSVHRGDEIAAWLAVNPSVVSYVIIDDYPILDFFREDQLQHLFKVDEMVGLDEETVKKVIDKLFR